MARIAARGSRCSGALSEPLATFEETFRISTRCNESEPLEDDRRREEEDPRASPKCLEIRLVFPSQPVPAAERCALCRDLQRIRLNILNEK